MVEDRLVSTLDHKTPVPGLQAKAFKATINRIDEPEMRNSEVGIASGLRGAVVGDGGRREDFDHK